MFQNNLYNVYFVRLDHKSKICRAKTTVDTVLAFSCQHRRHLLSSALGNWINGEAIFNKQGQSTRLLNNTRQMSEKLVHFSIFCSQVFRLPWYFWGFKSISSDTVIVIQINNTHIRECFLLLCCFWPTVTRIFFLSLASKWCDNTFFLLAVSCKWK